ncbi:MAG: hypothetical protein JNL98_09325 [Bryobacterales bacterium]|nr:hypothetical protein [Bryobacterales bacterium]
MARYGLPRPEACAALEGVTACPNIGFEGDFDTRLFQNGLYTLGVRIIDERSGMVTVPGVTATGVNIVTSN